MKTVKQKFIGLVSKPIVDQTDRPNSPHEIRVTIATLSPDDGKPRNWHWDWENPGSPGGCFYRTFTSAATSYGPAKTLGGYYGPEISYGAAREYASAATGLNRIAKALAKLQTDRGPAWNEAENMGRFLEASGIKQVYVCKDSRSGWLTESEYDVLSIGQFVARAWYHCVENVTVRAEELAKNQERASA